MMSDDYELEAYLRQLNDAAKEKKKNGKKSNKPKEKITQPAPKKSADAAKVPNLFPQSISNVTQNNSYTFLGCRIE